MKQIKNIHNQQCVKTNSMLSLYGFVEEHEIVVRDGKKEDFALSIFTAKTVCWLTRL